MVFGRKGLFGGGVRPAPRRVPFEPEGSTRQVTNAVPRGAGPVPLDAIIKQIREAQRTAGRDALTNLERWLFEAHILDSYAVHQGGLDDYLATIDDTARWADAAGALLAMNFDAAVAVMEEAVELFAHQNFEDPSPAETSAYLAAMEALDARFAALVPDLGDALARFADRYYPFAEGA